MLNKKFRAGLLAGTFLFASSTAVLASGPDGDNFTVVFNGQTSLSVGYMSGDLISEPTNVGATWGGPGAFLSPPLSVILGAGPLVAFDVPDASFTSMSTQYTRFGFTATGDTALGAFKAVIEGDFNGAGGNFRIRHAYGEVGPILAGQTWSLWNEGQVSISGWDWNGDPLSPGNNIARRQQLRYTTATDDGVQLAVAIEQASDTATAFTGLYTPNPEFFDITANIQAKVGDVDLAVSGIYSMEDDGLAAGGAPAGIDGVSFGVAASASFDLHGMDAGVVGVFSDGGAGMGRVNNTGGIDEAWGIGATLGGDIDENMSWNIGGSYTEADVLTGIVAPAAKR